MCVSTYSHTLPCAAVLPSDSERLTSQLYLLRSVTLFAPLCSSYDGHNNYSNVKNIIGRIKIIVKSKCDNAISSWSFYVKLYITMRASSSVITYST